MNKLIVLVGLAASGKSTYAKSYAESNQYIVHSSDALRAELYGDESVQGNNKVLFDELHKRIINDLKSNKNVIYDACNLSSKRRISFLQSIKSINCEKICVIIATPYEDCLKQNSERERKVPEEVIKRMYVNFNFSAYFEGWNDIQIINNKTVGWGNNYYEYFTYDQKNPNHTLTLGRHMTTCSNYIAQNYQSVDNFGELYTAGLIHDVGKPFCQTFINTKGEKTEKAHYYNHQNVGAYLAMTYDFPDILDKIKICTYIQWHMQPYFNNSEKSKNKYLNLWGKELNDEILILHKADEFGH